MGSSSPSSQPNATAQEVAPADWFNSLSEEPPQPQPKKSFKKIFVIIVGTLLTVSVILAFVFLNQGERCLSTDNLKSLTGNSEVGAITSPTDHFFTYTLYFQPNTASYDTTVDEIGSTIISKIASFYKENPKASMIFTLDTSYLYADNQSLAAQRLSTIQADLVKAGIPTSHITVNAPSEDDWDDTLQEEPTTATIAITSATTCK